MRIIDDIKFINDTLIECSIFPDNNIDYSHAKKGSGIYHYSTSYSEAPSIVKTGILSIRMLNELGIRKYTPLQLKAASDTDSHPNGIDGISFAITDLSDIDRRREDVYDSLNCSEVSIVVSGINPARDPRNYGNEYVYKADVVPTSNFKVIDVRLLQYAKWVYDGRFGCDINSLISRYNNLIDICNALITFGVDVPLREVSYGIRGLDIYKLSKASKLELYSEDKVRKLKLY